MAKLEADTGKSFAQWVKLAGRTGLDKVTDLQRWVVDTHGLGSRNAWWVAQTALAGSSAAYDDPEILVDALYSKGRAPLRPLHEALVDEFLGLGDDVLVTACKTMVPVYRKFVFAELRPARAGVEVHLALGDVPAGTRLRASSKRGGDERLTRAVVVEHADDIDRELRSWFASAYAAGAKRVERSTAFEVPPDFATALRKDRAAAATWAACTTAMQRDMLAWIAAAKQEATRGKRLAAAIGKLHEGKRRVY